MKILKLLMLIVSFLLFANVASAITTYAEWENEQSSTTINNGQQTYFDYALFSVNPPINYNIKMYNNNDILIKTLIQDTHSNENFISTRYFITQQDYITEGNYKIAIQGMDNLQDESSTILTLKVNLVTVNNAPVLNPIGNKIINEGQLLQFTITAIDPDNDPL